MRGALFPALLASCVLHGAAGFLALPAGGDPGGPPDARASLPARLQSIPRDSAPRLAGEAARPAPGAASIPAREASTPARPVAAEAAPERSPAAPGYWPIDALERQPMPVSAPDADRLEGLVLPQDRVRLRLAVDAEGIVRELAVASPGDGDWSPLLEIFAATRFIPGQRGGQNVACRFEIEILISAPSVPAPAPAPPNPTAAPSSAQAATTEGRVRG